jgi:hypothetical protein
VLRAVCAGGATTVVTPENELNLLKSMAYIFISKDRPGSHFGDGQDFSPSGAVYFPASQLFP